MYFKKFLVLSSIYHKFSDKMSEIKEIDRKICALLQSSARIQLSHIAEQVGLSVAAVSEHVRKLEEQGIIKGYYAQLNANDFNFDLTAYVFVDIESSVYYEQFITECKMMPELLECHAITGNASHLLKIRTINTASLEHLLSRLQQIPGVKRTITNLVLSTHIESLTLPLGNQS
jgi:Lrp/AsnC family leucine-responsive transcriptional regulator